MVDTWIKQEEKKIRLNTPIEIDAPLDDDLLSFLLILFLLPQSMSFFLYNHSPF